MSAQSTDAINSAPMVTASQPDQHGLNQISSKSSQAIAREDKSDGGSVDVADAVTAPLAAGDQ